MFKKVSPALMAAMITLWGMGCSDNTISEQTTAELNLQDDFGGYTASDEAPAFADGDLLDAADEEVEFNDPVANSPEVVDLSEDSESGHFHLRAVWGRLEFDPTVSEATDWTGSLTITRGAMVVRRVIRFERGQDYIEPRHERTLVEWVSQTTVHNDGIGVDIFVPPPIPEIDSVEIYVIDSLGDTVGVRIRVDTLWLEPDPVTVAFETGPYSRTFTLRELARLDTVVYLEDSNAVAFHAHELNHCICRRGFLRGTWGYDDEGNGVFKAVWIGCAGFPSGYMRGHWGVNDNGRKVFFGKWISANGAFEGLIRGVWGNRPTTNANDLANRRAGGYFAGRIYNGEGTEIGALGGRYVSHPQHRHGFLQGRWKLYCNELQGFRNRFDDGL